MNLEQLYINLRLTLGRVMSGDQTYLSEEQLRYLISLVAREIDSLPIGNGSSSVLGVQPAPRPTEE
jgi:hypothetical protein